MAKKKGRGWHGDSKRHSIAAKKGSAGGSKNKKKGGIYRSVLDHKSRKELVVKAVKKAKRAKKTGIYKNVGW